MGFVPPPIPPLQLKQQACLGYFVMVVVVVVVVRKVTLHL